MTPYSREDFAKNAWRRMVGLPEQWPQPMPPPQELERTEQSPLFQRLCMNRKIIGAFRYGRMGAPGKKKWDRVSDMTRRLNEYAKTGNQEHLVDVANLCELEFVEGSHPNKHFHASDDSGHTQPATKPGTNKPGTDLALNTDTEWVGCDEPLVVVTHLMDSVFGGKKVLARRIVERPNPLTAHVHRR